MDPPELEYLPYRSGLLLGVSVLLAVPGAAAWIVAGEIGLGLLLMGLGGLTMLARRLSQGNPISIGPTGIRIGRRTALWVDVVSTRWVSAGRAPQEISRSGLDNVAVAVGDLKLTDGRRFPILLAHRPPPEPNDIARAVEAWIANTRADSRTI